MKSLLFLLSIVALTGCSSVSGPGTAGNPSPAQAAATPRYEHQLEVMYADGATPFLHLVEVADP